MSSFLSTKVVRISSDIYNDIVELQPHITKEMRYKASPASIQDCCNFLLCKAIVSYKKRYVENIDTEEN